jgi:hypothetical protein
MIRKEPSESSRIPFIVQKDSRLFIVEGPVCADSFSWWKVTVPIGTIMTLDMTTYYPTTEERSGWIREGSDEIDPYFICREP